MFIGPNPNIESFPSDELAAAELNHRERRCVPHASSNEVRNVRLRAAQLASDFSEGKELAAPVRGEIDWRWHPPLQRRDSRQNSANGRFWPLWLVSVPRLARELLKSKAPGARSESEA